MKEQEERLKEFAARPHWERCRWLGLVLLALADKHPEETIPMSMTPKELGEIADLFLFSFANGDKPPLGTEILTKIITALSDRETEFPDLIEISEDRPRP